jgi:hypothetical protein
MHFTLFPLFRLIRITLLCSLALTCAATSQDPRLLPRFSDLFAAQPCRSIAPWQSQVRFWPHVLPAVGFRHAPLVTPMPLERITLAEDAFASGFCRSESQCKAVGGLALPTSCALGLGICCVDLAQCGRTVRQRDVRQGSRSFPDVQPRPGFCSLRVERAAPAIRLFKVTLEHVQLALPEMSSGLGCMQDAIWIESSQSPLDRLRACGSMERQTFLIRLPTGPTPPAANIRVASSGVWTQRRWLLRVQQFEASSGAAWIAAQCDQLVDLTSNDRPETFRPMLSAPLPSDSSLDRTRVYKTCVTAPPNTCRLLLLPAAVDHASVSDDLFAHWNRPVETLLNLATENERNALTSRCLHQSHLSVRQLSNQTTHAQPINYCANQLHSPILLRSPFELLVALQSSSTLDVSYRPLSLACNP